MTDIKDFVKSDKEALALNEINSDPVRYTKVFMRIFSKLCPKCKRRVLHDFRRNKNTSWNDYCKDCQLMAEEEYKCLR